MRTFLHGRLIAGTVLLVLFCRIDLPNNQFDPTDPDYVPPVVMFDSAAFANDDTIAPDTLRIAVRGNVDANIFRWRMESVGDTVAWSQWMGAGDTGCVIVIPAFESGAKSLHVQTAYHPNGEITDSIFSFFVAMKPTVSTITDSLVRIGTGESCTLRVDAGGTPALSYFWFRDTMQLDSTGTDSFVVTSAEMGDAGMYVCRVDNKWGSATGRRIRLAVVPLFNVRYHGNGNNGGAVPEDGRRYETGDSATVLGNTRDLSRIGFTFTGWNDAPDASLMNHAPGTKTAMGNADIVLYAKWTRNRYNVTFDTRGGSAVAMQTVDYGHAASRPADPSKPAETFTGWFADSSGTQAWVFTRDTIANDVTIFSGWTTRPTFTVSYSGNGSTGGSVPAGSVNYEAGATIVVLGNLGKLARTGHAFAGWNTAGNGGGKDYNGGETITIDSTDVTLFAKWAPVEYTVSFDTRGGSAVAPRKVLYGSTISDPPAPTLQGQTLVGWYGDSTFTQQWVFTRDTVSGDMSLFAKWTTNPTFTIAYDGNGKDSGAVPTDAGNYESGMTVTVAGNSGGLVRTGFTFTGWNTASDGSGTNRDTGSSFAIGTENVKLYARWSIDRHTVSYSGNEHTGGTAPPAATWNFGATVTVSENTGMLVKTGFTFVGWNTKVDGTGVNHAPGSMFAMGDSDVTLFAKWSTDQPLRRYIVRFYTDGGSAVDSQSVAEGDTVRKPVDPQKSGCDFAGWFREPTYVNQWVFASDTVAAHDTLFAKWTKRQYTVIFDARGGNPAPQAIRVDHGATITAPAAPVKPDSLFAGWFKENACVNSWMFESDTVVGDDTLFAKWEVKRYTVTFNSQSGSAATALNGVAHGSVIAEPAAPTRTGFTFGGWFKEAECANSWEFSSERVVGDDTLFARWTIRQYTVRFDSRGGSIVGQQTVNHGGHATEPGAPTKPDSVFAGWFREGGCINKWSFANDSVISDTVLYAKWNYDNTVRDIDGNVYHTVTIGTQTWLVENLKVTRLNDGTAIPNVTDNTAWGNLTTPGYCWYGNNEATYKVPYGALYNWFAVGTGKLAPVGWHVATDAEWTALGVAVGSSGKLKEATTTHWATPNTGADNETGFTALPGGYRYNYGTFTFLGSYGHWWTSTERVLDSAWNRDMHFNDATLFRNNYIGKYGFSVRCIKGNQYSVTFDSRSGSVVASQMILESQHAAEPVAPTRTGFNFAGWFKDTACVNQWVFVAEVVTGNDTLYAKWTRKQYAVRFDSRGGSAVGQQTVDHGVHALEPAAPTKSDSIFAGWFRQAGCVNQWVFASDSIVSDTVLFAKWNYSPTVTDIDGNVYHTITIGTQIWMVENLRTTRFSDGTVIPNVVDNTAWSNLTTPGYCWAYNDSNSFKAVYGALYNWYTVITGALAPAGWHVANDSEWTKLTNYLGGDAVAGGQLKEAGTVHWNSPNAGANNGSGFSALPGGYRETNGSCSNIGAGGYWWSSTESFASYAFYRYLDHDRTNCYRSDFDEKRGHSIRCIKGNQYAIDFNPKGGAAVTRQLVVEGQHATAPPAPTRTGYTFAGWFKDTACTQPWVFASETVHGDDTLFAKWEVRDIDGNVYTTVTIGSQVWMVENLKTTQYNDGSPIPLLTGGYINTPGYCWYDSDVSNKSVYGALYNWYAVGMGNLAPAGWHVPTDVEWDILLTHLGGSSSAGGKLKDTGTSYWSPPNTGATNESDFSAFPGGYRLVSRAYGGIGNSGYWWSSTENGASYAWYRFMGYNTTIVSRDDYLGKGYGFSVRCVRDY